MKSAVPSTDQRFDLPDTCNLVPQDGWTPLHFASYWGSHRVMKELLELGAKTDAQDKVKLACTVIVCSRILDCTTDCMFVHMLQRLRTPLHLAALQGDAASVTGLCTYKAKVNIKDEHALTPLHKAAAQGHDEAAEELLAHNANPNTTDEVRCHCATTLTSWRSCCHATLAAMIGLHGAPGPVGSCASTHALSSSLCPRIWQSPAEAVSHFSLPTD